MRVLKVNKEKGRTCHDGVHRPCDKPVCRLRHCRGTHDFRQCHVALAA